jgi:hypothetical protein
VRQRDVLHRTILKPIRQPGAFAPRLPRARGRRT